MFRGGGGGRPNNVKYQDFEDVAKSDQFGKAPVQNDDAFMHGVVCKAKFIGSMEIPRPKSRPEIISNMRRIRYEYKARNVVKVKVKIRISVSGLSVTKRQKKKRRRRSTLLTDTQPEVILESPIYRVFFVSHDSLDRQIFSLVCRAELEGGKKCFVCAVFKAYKKSHALRIVRTVGQVFDAVCRLQDTDEAKNIPGLLPPEKLAKLKEQKEASETTEAEAKALEALQEAEDASRALDESTADHDAAAAAPSTQANSEPLIQFDDNYEMQVKSFEEQQTSEQYNAQQAARLANANQVHKTESADLMREFGLSVDQQRFLLNNYTVPGQPNAARAGAGTAAAAGSGLPSPPPAGSRGILPPLQRTQLSVTSNNMPDDSLMMNLDQTDGGDTSRELLDSGSPIDVYSDPNNFSPDESKRLLPRLFAVQRAQSAQLQLLQDQLSAETRQRVVAEAKVEHLLQQNKELADHVTWLVQQVKTQAGSAPELPPTKRHIPTSEGAAASSDTNPLVGFDDSFVPPPTTAMTVHNGVPTSLAMHSKKPSSSDSESDSDNEEEGTEVASVRTAGTEVSPTPYGRLGDSTTDDELDGQHANATSTPAANNSAAPVASISELGDFPGKEVGGGAETQRLTFDMS
ncbi:dystrophin-like protein 1 [Sycon ciliatum]|uniref:dystrophin-like protein 1 n=1 Tax=Sycon ciliatum TaxID=27933 RepID=UPI0020A86A51